MNDQQLASLRTDIANRIQQIELYIPDMGDYTLFDLSGAAPFDSVGEKLVDDLVKLFQHYMTKEKTDG